MFPNFFANNLIVLRNNLGMTQGELSQKLNISRQAYCNYENDKRSPDIETLFLISQIHGVSIDDLLTKKLFSENQQLRERNSPYTAATHKASNQTLYLTDEEYQLLMNYQDLTKEEQDLILAFANKTKDMK